MRLIRIYKYLLIIVALFTIYNCSLSDIEPNISSDGVIVQYDGSLQIPLIIQNSEHLVVETRTTPTDIAEKITSIWAFVFEAKADGELDDNCRLLQVVRGSVNLESGIVYITLAEYPEKCYFRAMANLPQETQNEINNFVTVAMGVADGKVATTLAEYKNISVGLNGFYDSNDERFPNPMALANSFPMASQGQPLQNISEETVTGLTAQMDICGARVDIIDGTPGGEFTLESITLLNGSQKGYVRNRLTTISGATNYTPPPYNYGDVIQYADLEATGYVVSPIYLFPNDGRNGDNPTYFIIKGKKDEYSESGYYKFALRYIKNGESKYTYNIIRNVLYKVRLTSIEGPGYISFEEAKKNSPHNIKYDITVNDGTSNDVVTSNGQYYIGASHSEVHVYGVEANEIVLSTLTFGVNSNQQFPDLPAVSITSTSGVTITNTTDFSNITLNSPIDLKAILTTASGVDATVTIRCGNLEKVIKVKSYAYRKVQVDDFIAVDNAISAEIIDGGSFIRLSTTDGVYPNSETPSLDAPPAGSRMYIWTPKYTDFITRNGIAHIVRRDAQGVITNLKLILTQASDVALATGNTPVTGLQTIKFKSTTTLFSNSNGTASDNKVTYKILGERAKTTNKNTNTDINVSLISNEISYSAVEVIDFGKDAYKSPANTDVINNVTITNLAGEERVYTIDAVQYALAYIKDSEGRIGETMGEYVWKVYGTWRIDLFSKRFSLKNCSKFPPNFTAIHNGTNGGVTREVFIFISNNPSFINATSEFDLQNTGTNSTALIRDSSAWGYFKFKLKNALEEDSSVQINVRALSGLNNPAP